MPLTMEHSGYSWTTTKIKHFYGELHNEGRIIIKCFWDVEELFIRYPPFCKKAQRKYRKKYGHRRGIAEGTATRNCDCRKCKYAWSHPKH